MTLKIVHIYTIHHIPAAALCLLAGFRQVGGQVILHSHPDPALIMHHITAEVLFMLGVFCYWLLDPGLRYVGDQLNTHPPHPSGL